MSTFISRIDERGTGFRLAVKDCIDVAGVITTDGSPAVAATATVPRVDAVCVQRARGAGARIVGKANLHELCYGGTGVNEHYGTPVNPLDPRRVPGGSSSGSAVAVATGEADVALGTDTSGSIRIPAAACGVVGLRPTGGLVPRDGVLPLAPTFDVVGTMARTVAEAAEAMRWLAPGFVLGRPARTLVRLRPDVDVDPAIDAAVDRALASVDIATIDVPLPGWSAANAHVDLITEAEAARLWARLLDASPSVSASIADGLRFGASVQERELAEARDHVRTWETELLRLLRPGVVLALPTLAQEPALLSDAEGARLGQLCAAVSLPGLCSLALPVPSADAIASLQLVAAAHAEPMLLATAAQLEAGSTRRAAPHPADRRH